MSDCNRCVHLHRDPMNGTCDAYPTTIPHDIWSFEAGHDELRGDEKTAVTFEPINVSPGMTIGAFRTSKPRGKGARDQRGRFAPPGKGSSGGGGKSSEKAKAPADTDPIEHDPDFPVKDGFRRVTTHGERKALMGTHGVAIPPGYRNVQVSIDPQAPGLRARGTDAKGRVQSRYSAEHAASKSAEKFARISEFEKIAPKLDQALKRDATKDPDAGAVQVMRTMGLRPGSTADTKADRKAYGATTLEARHVSFSADGKAVTLDFDSKKGGHSTVTSRDPQTVATLKAHTSGKGPDDRVFDTSDAKTNVYIDRVTPGFTNKDLRTTLATGYARTIVRKMPRPVSPAEVRKAKRRVAEQVSQVLQNKPDEALKSYIAPEVFDAAGWD